MSLIDKDLLRVNELRSSGDLEGAVAALDALVHHDRDRLLPLLHELLDQLAVIEHGIQFRYIPAGSFMMGSGDGDPDEAPPHEVTLPGFWISEGPLSWAAVARAVGWPEPPNIKLSKEQAKELPDTFGYLNGSKIRLQYCENDTLRAGDWHAHAYSDRWVHRGQVKTPQELFGSPPRSSTDKVGYDQKPMVAVGWELAVAVGERMSSESTLYRLPTEAEWERAARGCFRSAPFPWGDAPPDETRADFGRFKAFALRPTRAFPPNDYGLFAVAGGVWEWCADDYDATFYARSPREEPLCRIPEPAAHREHVLRGGSWADCADALRTSFRSSGRDSSNPNVGFRLVRALRRG